MSLEETAIKNTTEKYDFSVVCSRYHNIRSNTQYNPTTQMKLCVSERRGMLWKKSLPYAPKKNSENSLTLSKAVLLKYVSTAYSHRHIYVTPNRTAGHNARGGRFKEKYSPCIMRHVTVRNLYYKTKLL